MKVGELIEMLKQYDYNAEVVVKYGKYGFSKAVKCQFGIYNHQMAYFQSNEDMNEEAANAILIE